MDTRYAIGIDLGTSNSALAITSITPVSPGSAESVQMVPIMQLTSAQTIDSKTTLPSALYLCTDQEQRQLPTLPWDEGQPPASVIGRFASAHGSLLPERLVTSAKSWLCNSHSDPQQPLLPWNSTLEERKVSPFDAQVQYLRHLRHTILRHELGSNKQPMTAAELEQCTVTITVPASFDEVARILTADAAEEAGWGQVTLLEEQQAAFYHWLEQSGDDWRGQVEQGDIILVCDIGGGTADFSLIAVLEQQGNLHLERISVGDHILLGGDNMDLALAYTLKAELEGDGQKIDNGQLLSLIHSCRRAKETLFSDDSLDSFPISIPSRGASLFAKTITTRLTRQQLHTIALDGFLPITTIEQQPTKQPRSGLKEVGLNYASDAVLSKHLAQFLVRSQINVESNPTLKALATKCQGQQNGIAFIRPSAVLFNGGIFKAAPIRQRVFELLQSFNDNQPLRELQGANFDLAVAKGAAVYARTSARGEGIRIKAGTARSYYIGIESSMPAIPGLIQPLKALCVVPQGMEEGSEFSLDDREFSLMTGQPVEFRFFSSSVRAGDVVGSQIDDAEELEETSQLEITLPPITNTSDQSSQSSPPSQTSQPSQIIPVKLHSHITELGTLELWMQHHESGQRWKIEFNVRGH
ncbi:MAG: Hsp70 family protein [Thermodesulfobacteriota bacterium]|nr:Hsp70 family protein [Thermodesulfobacteriota bacterium]